MTNLSVKFIAVIIMFMLVEPIGQIRLKTKRAAKKTLNVKTVLFQQKDDLKYCWSRVDLALLVSRYRMQDLIPYSSLPTDMRLLLEYLTLCLETIMKETAKLGSKRIILINAFSDALGGYLQAYGLPYLYEMYYEGYVDITTTSKIHNLQLKFKQTLGTDGSRWTKPILIKKTVCPVQPAKLTCQSDKMYCDKLAVKDSFQRAYKNNEDICKVFADISMPILDDCDEPESIAIPLFTQRLNNIKKASSKYILTIYYKNVYCCMEHVNRMYRNSCIDDETNFLTNFSSWLDKWILPRTKDETWYPAFIGVHKLKAAVDQDLKRLPKDHRKVDDVDKWLPIAVLLLVSFGLLWLVILFCRICCIKVTIKSTEECVEYSENEPRTDTSVKTLVSRIATKKVCESSGSSHSEYDAFNQCRPINVQNLNYVFDFERNRTVEGDSTAAELMCSSECEECN